LGTIIEVDTPEIRAALVARLDDPDDESRSEALVGLARRGDRRVVPALLKELHSDSVGSLAIEAAELLAAPELHSPLVALRNSCDDTADIDRAIAACSASAGHSFTG
jgi:HEAT repeat protein